MAERNKKNTKGIIIGICAAIVVVALIVVAIVLGTRNGGFAGLNDSYFVSDGSKLVIDMGDNGFFSDEEEYTPEKVYLVYSYSGDTINGLKAFYKYSDTDKAESAFNYLSENIEDEYKSIFRDGVYVILEANESEYENVTVDEVKQQIEFIEMIREQNQNNSEDGEIQVESVEPSDESDIEDTETVEE